MKPLRKRPMPTSIQVATKMMRPMGFSTRGSTRSESAGVGAAAADATEDVHREFPKADCEQHERPEPGGANEGAGGRRGGRGGGVGCVIRPNYEQHEQATEGEDDGIGAAGKGMRRNAPNWSASSSAASRQKIVASTGASR